MSEVRSRVKYSKLKATDDAEESVEVVAEVKNKKEAAKKTTQKEKQKTKLGRWAVPLPKDERDYDDEQFEDLVPIKAPMKSIVIAVVLFVLGSIFLTLGSLMLAGVLGQGQGSFRAMPLLVIGSIIFIPGAYNVRTAYYAWRGHPGFSYADIAGFGEGQ